jgi:hypothetical protein
MFLALIPTKKIILQFIHLVHGYIFYSKPNSIGLKKIHRVTHLKFIEQPILNF